MPRERIRTPRGASVKYRLWLITLSVAAGGCFDADRLPREARISCTQSSDCPIKDICVDGLCYDSANECILQSQELPAFAPPGTPCSGSSGGICQQGMCIMPFCGDGVITPPESCDSTPGCRIDCTACGDGILNEDSGEICDDGVHNSDARPGACRLDCRPAYCGDGVQDPGEGCDNGSDNNDDTPDSCRLDCKRASCGDGIVDEFEDCDSGTDNSDLIPDACRDRCAFPACGDGVIDAFEQCDDGKFNSDVQPVSCRTNCELYQCGDGVIDLGEECDRGIDNSDGEPGACRTDCRLASCGDGTVDPGEECDDGPGNSDADASACRVDCVLAFCGDGVVDEGESCDDGPFNSDYVAGACRDSCQLPSCGDGVRDQGEECDTGDERSDLEADACRRDCRVAHCGDGVIDEEEECDSGAERSDIAPDACRTDCRLPRCGDGTLDPSNAEECDTGIANSDVLPDACRMDCRIAVCGDGVRDKDEACDEGSVNSDSLPDTCREDCSLATCGDSTLDSIEECDDGNLVDGDGCSSRCIVEQGFYCTHDNSSSCTTECGDLFTVSPNEECDDGNLNEIDGCQSDCRKAPWTSSTLFGSTAATAASEISVPSGVTVLPDGSIVVAEGGAHRLVRLHQGKLEPFAGSGIDSYTGDGASAQVAGIPRPEGLSRDSLGRVALTDVQNHVVRIIEPQGKIQRIIGLPGWTGRAIQGALAVGQALNYPYATAFDGRGRLYISDAANYRVLRVDLDGYVFAIAGNGTSGTDSDGIQAIDARIACISGIAIDDVRQRIFLADSCSHRILLVQHDGTLVTVGGTTNTEDKDESRATDTDEDGVADVYTPSRLSKPSSVVVDVSDGSVYVAERSGHQIRQIFLPEGLLHEGNDGRAKSAWDEGPLCSGQAEDCPLCAGDRGCAAPMSKVVAGYGLIGPPADGIATQVPVIAPTHLSQSLDGNLYIIESGTGFIRQLDRSNPRALSTIAGKRDPSLSPRVHYVTERNQYIERRLMFDGAGRLLYAEPDEGRIVRVEEDGRVVSVAGAGQGSGAKFTIGTNECEQATEAVFGFIGSTAIDDQGRMYVSETVGARVRRINADGRIETILGTGEPGNTDPQLPANRAQVTSPYLLSVVRVVTAQESLITLYVSDPDQDRILRVTWPEDPTEDGSGCDPEGNLGDYGRVEVVAGGGIDPPPVAGASVLATNVALNYPFGIHGRTDGSFLFSERDGNRICEVTSDGQLFLIAGTGSFPSKCAAEGPVILPRGQDGICDAGYESPLNDETCYRQLATPGDLIEVGGTIVFAERSCRRIIEIKKEGDSWLTQKKAGAGYNSKFNGISGDGGPAVEAYIRYATGFVEKNGDLYFSDSLNVGPTAKPGYLRRVRTDGVIETVGGFLHPALRGGEGQGRLFDGRQLISLPDGRHLVAGGSSGVLLLVDLDNAYVSQPLGRPSRHYPNGGSQASFFAYGEPAGITSDPAGRYVYVSDAAQGRLLLLDLGLSPESSSTSEWSVEIPELPEPLISPKQMFMNESRTLYVADAGAHCVWAITLSDEMPPAVLSMVAAVGKCGTFGASPEGAAPDDIRLYAPEAVVQSTDGALYVSDTGNNRVISLRDNQSYILLGDHTNVVMGNGTPARDFSVDEPKGLWLDALGNLYVAGRQDIRMVADQDGDGVPEGSDRAWTIYEGRASGSPSCFEALTPLPPQFAPDVVLATDACNGSGVFLRPPPDPVVP